ncbi:MAG: hypothetical protein ACXAEL_13940 [Candidatus Hodarchaeales archaeon]|jgi:hypothetical protein
MDFDALTDDVQDKLDDIFIEAGKLRPDSPEIPDIIADIWFQVQRINVEMQTRDVSEKAGLLERLKEFVKKLLENIKKVASNLGVTTFSLSISETISIQLTFSWQLTPLIVA